MRTAHSDPFSLTVGSIPTNLESLLLSNILFLSLAFEAFHSPVLPSGFSAHPTQTLHEFLAALSDSSLLWAFAFLPPSSLTHCPALLQRPPAISLDWATAQALASVGISLFSTTETHFPSLQVTKTIFHFSTEQSLYSQTSGFFPHCLGLCSPYLCLSGP